MSSSNYRRVATRESAAASSSSDTLDANVTRSRNERLQDKLIALAWLVLAILVSRWTGFFSIIWSSDKPNRTLLRFAAMGLGIITAQCLYLTLYLPKVKGLVDSSAWSVYCPRVIPTMAVTGVISYLVFLRACWPVWGFLGPLIFGTQFMGLIMSLHFVPAMNLC